MFANLILTAWTSAAFACLITHFFDLTRAGSSDDRPGLFDRSTPANIERPFTTRNLLAYFVFAIGAASLVGIWLLNGVQVRDDVAVIAHRGAAGSTPENTVAAVRQAIDDGADWIEIDVQETRDGAVVVVHDRDFMKLAGVNLNVWDSTLEQLSEIDVGSWFDPGFSDQRVPTLANVLKVAKGRAGVLIELKYYGHDELLEERVVDVVERLDMINDVMIMSLNYAGMRKFRLLRPDWTIGLLAAQAAGNLARLDVDFLAVSSRIATPQFIRRSEAAGKPVYVWTVNDALNMSRMISLGVDGIITDEPALAREVLADRNELNSVERLLVQVAYLMGWQTPAGTYRDNSP
jgi:glycerophosphoryl diester phosphodiesterase